MAAYKQIMIPRPEHPISIQPFAGRAAAFALAKAGAQVRVHFSSGKVEAQGVVEDIIHAGGRAEAVGADLAQPGGPHQLARDVRRIVGDRLDVLVAHSAVGQLSAYAATKGAIDSLVKHFAAALEERGIRVNAVAPGVVATDMSSFTKTEAGRDFTLSVQSLKRLAQPDDIGGVIAFLASSEARWITGDTVRVDGGSKL